MIKVYFRPDMGLPPSVTYDAYHWTIDTDGYTHLNAENDDVLVTIMPGVCTYLVDMDPRKESSA